MTRICWWLVDIVSRMLEPDERDAVRGDFAESGETAGQALRDVLGLVARRQAGLWKDWRPWLALVGLVAPLGMLLGLASRRLADGSAVYFWMYLNNWTMAYLESAGSRRDLAHYSVNIFRQYLILMCWSWTAGFMLGSLSRRTIRINGALFCLVLLFGELLGGPQYLLSGAPQYLLSARNHGNDPVSSLTFYSVLFPLIVQAVPVLLPSLWGMHQGLRLATRPLLLHTILWASAIATITTLAIRNWGWVLCLSGRFQACMDWQLQAGYARLAGRPQGWQIPTLPLALVGPVAYMVATANWRRWVKARWVKTEERH